MTTRKRRGKTVTVKAWVVIPDGKPRTLFFGILHIWNRDMRNVFDDMVPCTITYEVKP